MPERLSDIEASSLGPQSLEARLKAYPELRAKIETMPHHRERRRGCGESGRGRAAGHRRDAGAG